MFRVQPSNRIINTSIKSVPRSQQEEKQDSNHSENESEPDLSDVEDEEEEKVQKHKTTTQKPTTKPVAVLSHSPAIRTSRTAQPDYY